MTTSVKYRSEPVLMTNYASDWPALNKWNIQWFLDKYGDNSVGVNTGKYIRADKYPNYAYSLDKTEITLKQYLMPILNNESVPGYLAAHSFVDDFAELLTDIKLSSLAHNEKYESKHFWISAPNTITQLHFDRANNILTQIYGTKRVYLYAPKRSLKPMRILNNWAVDVSELEVDEITNNLPEPDFIFDISPGDALYIPYGWWHKVVSLSASISVNQWWWNRRMLLTRLPEVIAARLKVANKKYN